MPGCSRKVSKSLPEAVAIMDWGACNKVDQLVGRTITVSSVVPDSGQITDCTRHEKNPQLTDTTTVALAGTQLYCQLNRQCTYAVHQIPNTLIVQPQLR
jgi:hypothetical protein